MVLCLAHQSGGSALYLCVVLTFIKCKLNSKKKKKDNVFSIQGGLILTTTGIGDHYKYTGRDLKHKREGKIISYN